MTEIIPATDIIEGRCVRLSQGDYTRSRVYDASPLDMALRFQDAGVHRLHLVDLDGAKASQPINLHVLEEIATHTNLDIEWGGGIKSRTALEDIFAAGAGHAICGSIAVRQPELFSEWLESFGSERIILGADARNGRVAVNGWLEDSTLSIDDIVKQFLPNGLSQVICTDISCDGMLTGPSFDLYANLKKAFPEIVFTVSGGVGSVEDLRRVEELGLPRVIIGKAIYEGRISLEDIKEWTARRA